jgi:hypothetical protein
MVGQTLTDAKVCFEQLEEERWKKFMQLFTEGTGMGEDDLCDLDQYLRDGRLGTARLTETEKGHAHVSAAKQSLGEVVTDSSNAKQTAKMLDFLASFSSNKKVFVSDVTVAEKVAQMEKVGDGGRGGACNIFMERLCLH